MKKFECTSTVMGDFVAARPEVGGDHVVIETQYEKARYCIFLTPEAARAFRRELKRVIKEVENDSGTAES